MSLSCFRSFFHASVPPDVLFLFSALVRVQRSSAGGLLYPGACHLRKTKKPPPVRFSHKTVEKHAEIKLRTGTPVPPQQRSTLCPTPLCTSAAATVIHKCAHLPFVLRIFFHAPFLPPGSSKSLRQNKKPCMSGEHTGKAYLSHIRMSFNSAGR